MLPHFSIYVIYQWIQLVEIRLNKHNITFSDFDISCCQQPVVAELQKN